MRNLLRTTPLRWNFCGLFPLRSLLFLTHLYIGCRQQLGAAQSEAANYRAQLSGGSGMVGQPILVGPSTGPCGSCQTLQLRLDHLMKVLKFLAIFFVADDLHIPPKTLLSVFKGPHRA